MPDPVSGSPSTGQGERPAEPELRTLQRARLILGFEEAGERHENAEHGWLRLLPDGWLLWLSDEDDEWQLWPRHNVIGIDLEFGRDGVSDVSD